MAQKQDEVAGVRLSHPEKVLFPSQGLTKSDLASHYEAVAERMLPHIQDRPLSLVRCPQGRAQQMLFPETRSGRISRCDEDRATQEGSGAIEDYYLCR